jgi:hypothetical protein
MSDQPRYLPTASITDEVVTVRVRRSPKYGVFLLLGAALGILVAMILTFAFDGSALPSPNTNVEYTQLQVFGFVALICIPIGVALGGVVALVLDRIVGRRTRSLRMDHETVHFE